MYQTKAIIVEKRPQILLNPYQQIASSFILGTKDRFGHTYQSM